MKKSFILFWVLLTAAVPRVLAQDDQHAADQLPSGVAGNPFLLKDWAEGHVFFENGRMLDQFKLKFDVSRNLLLMQFQGSTFAADLKVQAFSLFPGRKKKDSLFFRKGYPPVDKASKETFYQVLIPGSRSLLCLHVKNIVEEKRMISNAADGRGGAGNSYFVDQERYYLYDGQQLTVLTADRQELARVLPDPDGKLKVFLQDNPLRFNTADDFISLIRKYNEWYPH